MVNSGKCPSCDMVLNDHTLKLESVSATNNMRTRFNAIQFVCNGCKTTPSMKAGMRASRSKSAG